MPGQSKRRRISGDATGREGLTELEVLSISGECMVTLNVPDSMSGRDLWNLISGEVPTKPGLQLVVSHTARLALIQSLQQQGLGGQRAQVSATYIPVNLLAALRFACGRNVADEEFSLSGITEMTGVSSRMPALLHNLPKSLDTLTFAPGFNQELHHMRLPEGLRTLTFGQNFNQSLDNVTWPAGLQSLTFGARFNQSLDNVKWLAGLQRVTFGAAFNRSLDNVTWPGGLRNLTFGERFNQNLDSVIWPAGLQRLSLGLQSLSFGDMFDQSLDNVTWPAGLQSLNFGENFNQNLDNVTWPAGLQSLTFGVHFNQSLDNVTWPAGLQSLTFETFSADYFFESWPTDWPRALRERFSSEGCTIQGNWIGLRRQSEKEGKQELAWKVVCRKREVY
eukprot:symbB.v1.2.037174.t1/scaffold5412.1/size27432/3